MSAPPSPPGADNAGSLTQLRACLALNAQGAPCQAPALTGEDHCFWHSPKAARKRAEARRRGGRNALAPGPGPSERAPLSLRTHEDVFHLLSEAGADILAQPPSERRGRALIYLALGLIRAIEVGELEGRLAALEERLNLSLPTTTNWRKTWPPAT